jgi:hypothetical protein
VIGPALLPIKLGWMTDLIGFARLAAVVLSQQALSGRSVPAAADRPGE